METTISLIPQPTNSSEKPPTISRRKSKVHSASRSLAWIRKHGFHAATVERWNAFAGPINPKTGKPVGKRQDLFGFADIIAFLAHPDVGPLGFFDDDLYGRPVWLIQSTLGKGEMAEHVEKLTQIPAARDWVASGNVLEIHSWAKRGQAGKQRWTVVRRRLKLDDFRV